MREDRSDDPLSQQFVQVHVEPCLLLRAQAHGLCPDGDLIAEAQLIVVLGVPHCPDVRLQCCQARLEGDQASEKIAPGRGPHRLAKCALGQGQVSPYELGGGQGLGPELPWQQIMLG